MGGTRWFVFKHWTCMKVRGDYAVLTSKTIPEEKTKTIQKRISGYIIHDHPQRITTSLLFHDALRRRGSVCAAGNVPKWFKRTTEAKPRVPLKKNPLDTF